MFSNQSLGNILAFGLTSLYLCSLHSAFQRPATSVAVYRTSEIILCSVNIVYISFCLYNVCIAFLHPVINVSSNSSEILVLADVRIVLPLSKSTLLCLIASSLNLI
jgi:hypothetical protein